jgi:hypothetical protein
VLLKARGAASVHFLGIHTFRVGGVTVANMALDSS